MKNWRFLLAVGSLVLNSACDRFGKAMPVASCSRVTITTKAVTVLLKNMQVGQGGFIFRGHFYEIGGLLYVDRYTTAYAESLAGENDIHITRVKGGFVVRCDATTTAEHAENLGDLLPVVGME